MESILGDSVEYLSLYGATCRRLGLFDLAASHLKKAIQLDPSNITIQNNYANLLIDLNEFDESRKILTSILDSNPQYIDARENLNRLNYKVSTQVQENNSVDLDVSRSRQSDFDPLMLAFTDEEVKNFSRLTQPKVTHKSAAKLAKEIPEVNSQILASEQLKLAQQSIIDRNYEFCLELCSKVLKAIGPNEAVYDCAADAYIATVISPGRNMFVACPRN